MSKRKAKEETDVIVLYDSDDSSPPALQQKVCHVGMPSLADDTVPDSRIGKTDLPPKFGCAKGQTTPRACSAGACPHTQHCNRLLTMCEENLVLSANLRAERAEKAVISHVRLYAVLELSYSLPESSGCNGRVEHSSHGQVPP